MAYEPIWGGIIAWYLFLAGLGGGAFVASAYLRAKHPQAKRMRRAGHLIAPGAVIVGLVLLMLDAEAGLHNPLRFALLLSNFGSVMTWGVVFLAGFVVVALVVAGLDIGKREVPKSLEAIGATLAVCVAVYTGALLGVTHTFPLWNSAILPVLFLVSALSAGIASVMLYGCIAAPGEFEHVEHMKKGHQALPIIELFLIASLLFITIHNSTAGYESVMSLLVGSHAVFFWVALVTVGLVLPAVGELVLESSRLHSRLKMPAMRVACATAELGVLIGGWTLRYLVVVAALPLTLVG